VSPINWPFEIVSILAHKPSWELGRAEASGRCVTNKGNHIAVVLTGLIVIELNNVIKPLKTFDILDNLKCCQIFIIEVK
jgi:hypothetical protein